jgi:hypothetical protein
VKLWAEKVQGMLRWGVDENLMTILLQKSQWPRRMYTLGMYNSQSTFLHEPVYALYYNFHIICLFCLSRTCGNFKQWFVSGGTGKRDNWFENCCIRKVTDVGTYLGRSERLNDRDVCILSVWQFPAHFYVHEPVLRAVDSKESFLRWCISKIQLWGKKSFANRLLRDWHSPDCWPNSAWIIALLLS